MNEEPVLELSDLSRHFGGFKACDGIHLTLRKGERRALIGPNGAGKTTAVNLITGRLVPTRGKVCLRGENITALRPDERVKRGLVRNFQITNLFKSFSAFENVALAVSERRGDALALGPGCGFSADIADEAEAILAGLGLTGIGDVNAQLLPYGRQRLVELAMALALKPQVLLLDEPAAGLPSMDHAAVLGAIKALPKDVSVLLIEHDMSLVFAFAETMTVLAEGRVIAEGSPDEMRRSSVVREVYLGSTLV